MKKLSLLVSAVLSMVYSTIAGQLAWDPSTDTNVIGYRLYQSLGTSAFTPVATVAGRTTSTLTIPFDTNQVSRFYLVSTNSAGVESIPSNIATNTPPPPPNVYYTFEAENGVIAAPMVISPDSLASGGNYVSTTTSDAGTETYTVNVQYAGDYVIWCRIIFLDGGTDSFYVSMDGVEDIFGMNGTVNTWSPNWQWSQINAGNGSTLRVFNLSNGNHTLVFRGREPGSKLDKLIVTNNLNFVPVDATPPNPPPNIRVTSVVP